MAHAKEQLILFSAQQDNILPLTSACNVQCVFCSHHQNPRGVEVYGIGHRSLEEIAMTLEFIDPERKIVIGESVTRIMEGEPFLHPEIRVILRSIREQFPCTMIQITTNGTLLIDEMLDLLEELGQIELYISLNSATPRGREILMGDSGEIVRSAIAQLRRRGIVFQGSIVAMPWLVGWNDLEETVAFLDEHGAETVRIFMPGYTAKAPAELRFDPELPYQLLAWADLLQRRYRTPLTVEPAFLTDLRAIVEGVVEASPAEDAGIQRGDEIVSIDGEVPFSRVEAFQWLARRGKQTLRVKREWKKELEANVAKSIQAKDEKTTQYIGEITAQDNAEKVAQNNDKKTFQFVSENPSQNRVLNQNVSQHTINGAIRAAKNLHQNAVLPREEITITLNKEPDSRSGVVFAYDLHPDVYEQVYGLIMRHRAKRTLLMASTLAEPLIRQLALRLQQEQTLVEQITTQAGDSLRIEVVAVPNRFFGGSIVAGGLLVVQDFLDCWAEIADSGYELILAPGIFLDPWGVDLVGRRFSELEEQMKIPVEMVEI